MADEKRRVKIRIKLRTNLDYLKATEVELNTKLDIAVYENDAGILSDAKLIDAICVWSKALRMWYKAAVSEYGLGNIPKEVSEYYAEAHNELTEWAAAYGEWDRIFPDKDY